MKVVAAGDIRAAEGGGSRDSATPRSGLRRDDVEEGCGVGLRTLPVAAGVGAAGAGAEGGGQREEGGADPGRGRRDRLSAGAGCRGAEESGATAGGGGATEGGGARVSGTCASASAIVDPRGGVIRSLTWHIFGGSSAMAGAVVAGAALARPLPRRWR